MDDYLGTIVAFAFNFAPTNWLPCDGRTLAIQQYAALFSLLGTYYGGNGTTTFALPDLRGRVGVSMGTGPGLQPITIGQQAGLANVTLTAANVPAHTHAVTPPVSSSAGTATSPQGGVPATTAATVSGGSGRETATVNSYAASGSQTGASFNTAPAGGGQPFAIMPPYLGLNYCICVAGIYPSRP